VDEETSKMHKVVILPVKMQNIAEVALKVLGQKILTTSLSTIN